MKQWFVLFALMLCGSYGPGQTMDQRIPVTDPALRERAVRIAMGMIIVDTHIDVLDRIARTGEDISRRTRRGCFDYPRAFAGGLSAPFISVYTPSSFEQKGGARACAEKLISMVEKWARDAPDKFALARSVKDVEEHFTSGRISLPMGMENGSPLESTLANVRYFYDRGIRYITLAHSKSNHLSDSSYDEDRPWNGLSPFGRSVVEEMNRVGMMVDVSHLSDSAFYQVMQISKAPVIASHSSCRHFTPGFERNMSDDMIRLLASHGGVIHINFGSVFLREEIRSTTGKDREHAATRLRGGRRRSNTKPADNVAQRHRQGIPTGHADIADVVAHIRHVVELVGVDYVGLGSDFDGVENLPTGLKDVSEYPNLVYALLREGYTESDVKKICGGNTLRVWSEVERVARELQLKD
jgi:membrane dipeptidase